jgi:hypothetical protein
VSSNLFYVHTYPLSPDSPPPVFPNHCLCNFFFIPIQAPDPWPALLLRSRVLTEASKLPKETEASELPEETEAPGVMEVQEPMSTTLCRSSDAHFAAAESQQPSRAKELLPAIDTIGADFQCESSIPLIQFLYCVLPMPPIFYSIWILNLGAPLCLQSEKYPFFEWRRDMQSQCRCRASSA